MNANLLKDVNKVEYSEILNFDSTFILSSYYWGKDRINENSVDKLTYQDQIDRLIDHCREHKVNYYFVRYPIFEQKGMYITALSLKSQFILNTLDKFPEYKVINIDSDFSLLQYPHIFDTDADCFFINWYYLNSCFAPFNLELPGGVLGFANTHNARVILNILNNYILKNSNLAEDKTFSGIFTRGFLNLYARCVWLPYNYMYMFKNHEYDQENNEYTHIASYADELKDNIYKKKDLVIVHRDMETYELLNIRGKRVGTKSIWPPNFYRQQGEKLRCLKNVTFNNYVNYGFNKKQMAHFAPDLIEWSYDNRYRNMLLPKIEFVNERLYSEKDLSNDKNFIVISISDNIDKIHAFKKNCNKHQINYVIFKNNEKSTSKAHLFYKVLQKYKKNIVYININYKLRDFSDFSTKNMDFMTNNTNNNNVQHIKICYDPRVLKISNDNLYYFAYNPLVLNFLQIWASFNKNLKYQDKNLEYAFNKSLSVNKLRCFWLNKTLGDVNKLYPNDKFKKFTTSIQQCGIKPALTTDGNPLQTHFSGSKQGKNGRNKYAKLFLF